MKKFLIAVLSFLTLSVTFAACNVDQPDASSSEEQSSSISSSVDDSVDGSSTDSSDEDSESSVEESSSTSDDSSVEESSSITDESSVEESSSTTDESSVEESSSTTDESSVEESSSITDDSSKDESESSKDDKPGSKYDYNAFTPTEKALFKDILGEVIPFLPNNEYYAEEYTLDYYDGTGEGEYGVNFYTFGNTKAEFNAYREKYSKNYEFVYSEKDDYGDTWYYYDAENYCVDMAYYEYDDGVYIVDVYAYIIVDMDDIGGDGSWNNSGSWGDWSGWDDWGDGSSSDVEVITNEGKGLPKGENGVYNVDFTKADVKDVSGQGYYLDGCPTTGDVKVLVIPVEFSDAKAADKGYTIDKIKYAFNGGETSATYTSVKDFYYVSSYNRLSLDFVVLDSWFMPEKASSYYAKQESNNTLIGDQIIIDEALQYLEKKMDLSEFDSDKNGTIDAIVLINTLEIDSNKIFQWAYRYWNTYGDKNNDDYYYKYDGVYANDYLWASYQFMLETYDENDQTIYKDDVMNTYTYIHEFGHVLGADDYYDTSYSETEHSPLGGCDVMDSLLGDHNPYTKFNYGWLTSSRLVVAEDKVTLTLEDFSKNGDTIIIANNWDEKLGAYQEYYVVMYYRCVGLNDSDADMGYFGRDGIVVYHVNASLYKETYDGEVYYDVYNNNTDPSDEYGTQDDLIEFVKCTNTTETDSAETDSTESEPTFTYIVGDSLSSTLKDSQGNTISYVFTVDSLTETTATLTFTKNA